MEDWQQWQIRADQVAETLRQEVSVLRQTFFDDAADPTFRAFWPRFRELKERVRTAPAIKLEDKLDLERQLRDLGSRAYRAQEATYAGSGERKTALLASIEAFRSAAENESSPRALRALRRELDGVREQFDGAASLVPSDRQTVWDAWRQASQFVWQRLTALWSDNEGLLQEILQTARQQLEAGNANAARQAVGRFFEALRTHEARQNAINALKSEAEGIRGDADRAEERGATERAASRQAQYVPPLESWRAELERNREVQRRLIDEVAALDRQFKDSGSILEQAMIRGDLVDKRRKLSEIERAGKTLEQRIGQAEEAPIISAG